MTDRELLEMAAKASCIGAQWVETEYEQTFKVPYETPDAKGWAYWNPLTDDGDALRLATKLELSILPGDGEVEVWAEQLAYKLDDGTAFAHHATEKYQGDICVATRRAIVRAAAEIGKAMP